MAAIRMVKPSNIVKGSRFAARSTMVTNPKNGIIGKMPTFKGTLNDLSVFGSLYLRIINYALTKQYTANVQKSATLATTSILPSRTKNIVQNITKRTAAQGCVCPYECVKGILAVSHLCSFHKFVWSLL